MKRKNFLRRKLLQWFLRLDITQKMLLGYSSLLILLVLISIFALLNLKKLNDLNTSILKRDIPLIEASDKMIETILAQELYVRRYGILKSPEMLGLFWRRSQEFEELAGKIEAIPEGGRYPIDKLTALHGEYNDILVKGLKSMEKTSTALAKNYDKKIKEKQEQIVGIIKKMASEAIEDQNEKMRITSTIGTTAFQVAVVLCSVGILLSVAAATMITRNISSAIQKLKHATRMISQGNFDHRPDIQNEDELGELSHAFVSMAKRLKNLEEMYLDASPLTRLPGGVAIENVLRKRIEGERPLAFCLVDLDNFKAYNDRYGYAKGNEMIQSTAHSIVKAVSGYGSDDDFVGHIGGDDFVLITSPERYIDICKCIIEEFDKTLHELFDEEDRQRGYMIGKNRQGEDVSFPLTSISISVVTNQNRKIESYIQVGEIAAELKEYAKSLPGSIYVVDRRRKNK